MGASRRVILEVKISMKNQTNQVNQVEPYTIGKALIIVVLLAALDTFGCVVLLIGGYIFSKKGHTGLAIALAVANFIVPDMLPVVDEIFTVIAVVVPIYQSYKSGEDLKTSVTKGVESYQQYNSDKKKYNLNPAKNTLTDCNYDNDNYDDNYDCDNDYYDDDDYDKNDY